MKRILIFIAIFHFATSLEAQEGKQDYIVKTDGTDTIWCKITKETPKYLYYTENNFKRAVKKGVISAFGRKQKPNLAASSNPELAINDTGKTSKRPKILLDVSYTGSSYTSPTVYYGGGGGVKSGGFTSAPKRLTFIDPVTNAKTMLGLKKINLEKYLKADAEAFKLFKASRRAGSISWFSSFLCIGTAVPVVILMSNSTSDEASPGQYVLAFTAVISGVSALISGHNNNKYLYKSVKVYNRNAGYGYINGLERK